MEWISRSDGPRLFQCGDDTSVSTRCLLRRQDLSRSDQCTPGSPGLFPSFCPALKNENADAGTSLSDGRAFGRQVRWWGLVSRAGERAEEEEGVWNLRTRSLGDRSPGSPSVWQLWKFIAIDFVISSLSIRSTWAQWWITRKLFLQSCCFFFFQVYPSSTEGSSLRCPLFIPICWDVSIVLFIFSSFFIFFFTSLQ